jgi:hypothetical protein
VCKGGLLGEGTAIHDKARSFFAAVKNRAGFYVDSADRI